MIIFSLILASETAMREITSRNLASVWFEKLRPAAKTEVETVYNNRVKNNTEVTKLDCLMIHDLLALMNECTGIVTQLGFTKSQFKKWKERLRLLRDTLAHGAAYFTPRPDPMRAVQLFEDVRGFAEKTTRFIATRHLRHDLGLQFQPTRACRSDSCGPPHMPRRMCVMFGCGCLHVPAGRAGVRPVISSLSCHSRRAVASSRAAHGLALRFDVVWFRFCRT